MNSLVIEGCAVATMNGRIAIGELAEAAPGEEHAQGHLVLTDGLITSVGPGPAPVVDGARVVDGSGCLATPGLVGAHHHLFQGLTRGLAQDAGLVDWLGALYPLWAHLDPGLHAAAARAGLATLALSGCTTTADHHYLFPRTGGYPQSADDLLAAGVAAAREIGLRLHACRGSMDLGVSAGGLPPDTVVEDRDQILAATQRAVEAFHDRSQGAMVQVAVAPCAPLTVSGELLRESADLARRHGVRLHTHLAETGDEHSFCVERFGRTPAQHLESLGWLGEDVWVAHGVHLDPPAIARLAQTGTAVAHCPTSNARLGAGIAPVQQMLAAGVVVGLGVDGSAANEHGSLAAEMRQALLAARARPGRRGWGAGAGQSASVCGGRPGGDRSVPGGGPGADDPVGAAALGARQALALATRGGARCLGREAEIGSLEVGKQADVALWRIDDLGHAAIDDPVWALVAGPPARLELLTVAGRTVVESGELRTADPSTLSLDLRSAVRELRRRHDASHT